jgi:hypothetical protein
MFNKIIYLHINTSLLNDLIEHENGYLQAAANKGYTLKKVALIK